MDKRTHLGTLAVAGCIISILTGCSLGSLSDDGLQASDVRPALRGLPFHYRVWAIEPPARADSAFRGVAHGKYGTTLHFSIALGGTPGSISIPNTKLDNPTSEGEAGFVFNSDSADVSKFKTTNKWKTVGNMAVEIEEHLCKKATGQACPI